MRVSARLREKALAAYTRYATRAEWFQKNGRSQVRALRVARIAGRF